MTLTSEASTGLALVLIAEIHECLSVCPHHLDLVTGRRTALMIFILPRVELLIEPLARWRIV